MEKILEKNIIQTPDISHATSQDWNYVYEPAEDTFFMLDALENDLNHIQMHPPTTVLEVGSGSGLIITALSQVLKSGSHCIAIDINKYACQLSKFTSIHNKQHIDVIQGDLMSCFKSQTIDLIIFNPPYVVTTSSEVHSEDILTRSWAGGIDGMEITNKFLLMLSDKLSKNGSGYLLALKENKPNEIIMKLQNEGIHCEIIAKRKIRCEELYVLKFLRKEPCNNQHTVSTILK